MSFAAIDTLGSVIVLATIVAAIAIIFCAYVLLRPQWRFALQNGSILPALILDLTLSMRVFEPSLLRAFGPLVAPGTEMLYCFVLPLAVITTALFAWPYMRHV